MSSFIAFTLFGLFTGAAYAIAASGLVLTYTTTRVFNIAHGAFGMVLAFVVLGLQRPAGDADLAGAGPGARSWSRPAIGWFIAAVRRPRPRRGPGQRLAGRHRRAARRAASGWRSRSARPSRARVLPFFAGKTLQHRRRLRHRPPGHHDRRLGRGRGRPLRAAQPHPDRHRDARLGRQPRAAPALRRQARPGRRAVLGDRHLAGRRSAGILLVSIVGLDYYALTLLVINAYAAAMLGRLKSLPLTFVGAMGLGLLHVVRRRLPATSRASSPRSRTSCPALFLFVVVVAMPQAQLRIGQVKGIVSAPLPSLPRTLGWSAGAAALRGPARRRRCPTPTCCWSAPPRRSRS